MRAEALYPQRVSKSRERSSTSTIESRSGVICLHGYGIRIAVERGHLVVEDGIGLDRRRCRFSRIDPTVRRLIIIGQTGSVSLDAIRWIANVGATLVQIDVAGKVLMVAGASGPDYPVLRRAQARAVDTEIGRDIMRGVLIQKLEGQQKVLRSFTEGQLAIPKVELAKRGLREARDFIELRAAESRAASAYWGAWESVPAQFGRKDAARVPSHWQSFGSRTSVLTSSPRLAVNPANAILNYAYSILEAEARIALLTVGCDPGVGIQHADQRARDSMACDVMEAVRPEVDAYLLDLLASRVFRRQEFFETQEGGCRLMPALTAELSHTANRWAKCLGPVVERVAKLLYDSATAPATKRRWISRRVHPKAEVKVAPLPTPLTESNRSDGRRRVHQRSDAKESSSIALRSRGEARPDQLPTPVILGMVTDRDVELSARRFLTAILAGLEPLTRAAFLQAVIPALRTIPAEAIAEGVGLSVPYCAKIRAGACVPRRKHWESFRRFLLARG